MPAIPSKEGWFVEMRASLLFLEKNQLNKCLSVTNFLKMNAVHHPIAAPSKAPPSTSPG
jgi:hypothetical protein